MSRARPSFPGDDPAVLCAAIEREVEFWGKLRRSQGSKPPRCTPSHALDYLFGGNGWLTPHALRRAEAAGLVAKADFGCGFRGWRLTRKGSALAQEGELLCRDCATAPSLDDEDALARCPLCAAELFEDRAETEEQDAEHWREAADEHDAAAVGFRARAEEFRALTARAPVFPVELRTGG